MIRTSMSGLSAELQQSLNDLEPLLNKIASSSKQVRTDAETLDQLQAMTDLRQSMDALNVNLNRLVPQKRPLWLWRHRGQG